MEATYISEHGIQCLTPSSSVAASFAVAITTNGVHFTQTHVVFNYVNAPSIEALSPNSGYVNENVEESSTSIHIKGEFPFASSSLVCIFGEGRQSSDRGQWSLLANNS